MIHWGILGAGHVARRFAQSLRHEPHSELGAIALRSSEKAEAFLREYPAKRCYLDYDALLLDPSIDAIYLSLPHGLHAPWALKALRQGKAVLCEKPAVVHASQMRAILQTAREEHVLFMEAMKTRFVPLHAQIMEQLEQGVIGPIQTIEVSLCNEEQLPRKGTTYHTQEGQGGALLDVGIYCISWIEELLKGDIRLVRAEARIAEGIDWYVSADLSNQTIQAHMETAFDRKKPRNLIIRGEKGTMIVEEHHRPQRATILTDTTTVIEVPYVYDDFYGQIAHFVELMEDHKTQSPIMPLSASLRCSELLDRIHFACRQ